MARKPTLSVEELFSDALGELRLGLERPNIYGYTPYPEQEAFHRCEKWGRYLAGGNRGGKCLVEGTLVQMADGRVKAIEDIEVGEYVISPSGSPTRVTATWDKGIQPVNRYRIGRYQDLVEVVATENHKFWGARESHGKLGEFERFPIKELMRKGDKIMRSQGTQLGGVREERAYVLGLTYGDGQAWHDWLSELGLSDTRSQTKFIPAEVWGWDEQSIGELIAGLASTDGSWRVSSRGEHHFEFVSMSRELIEGFRRLAGIRLGIWGSTITTGSKGTWCVNYGTREALEKLAALPIVGKKRALAEAAVPKRNSYSSHVSVREFTDEGWQQCYDITVEDETHCFMLANGLFTSNTDAMVAEMIWIAIDEHPWRERPESWGSGTLQLRCYVVDVEKGVKQIMLPKLKRYIPTSHLIDGDWSKSWDQNALILTFANGNTIDFLTYGMGLEKMGGVPRHAIFFDEEPPQEIFNEAMLRLLDYEGIWVIAATPVEGIGWTFDLLWDRGITTPEDPASPGCFTLSAAKNPYLKAKAETFSKYAIGMDKEEQQMRFEGEFVARSGLVFPNFSTSLHVVDPYEYFSDGRPPADWKWYSSVDHGLNNPTAWLWHGVSPHGDIITFAEHYKSDMVIDGHAAIVHAREASWGRRPDIRTGDPAMSQRTAVTGTNILQEYAMRGIFIGVKTVPRDVETGIERMRSYLQAREQGSYWGKGRPKWVIADACTNFIREMKKLRWATYDSRKTAYSKNAQEVVHKKDDHAFDSARYFATQLPNLSGAVAEPGERYGTGPRSYADLISEDVNMGGWAVENVSDDDWY